MQLRLLKPHASMDTTRVLQRARGFPGAAMNDAASVSGMRRTLITAIALVVGIGAGIGIGSFFGGDEQAAKAATPKWLFVLTSEAGQIVAGDDGTFTLTLADARDRLVRFSDRPARFAGDTDLD